MTTPRRIHDLVLDLLRTVGPMTRLELEPLVPVSRQHLQVILADLQGKEPAPGLTRTPRGRLPRQIRIADWRRDSVGGTAREQLRPVYAPGDKADAPHPGALTGAERLRRQRAKASAPRKTARAIGNSVFTWRPQA